MWKTSSQYSAWQRRTSRPSSTKVLSVVQWVRRQRRLLSDTKRHWFWASHACQNLSFVGCCVYTCFHLEKTFDDADVMVGSTWWSRCCTESNFYPWSVEPLWKKAKLGRFCQRLASKISWSRPFTTLKCGQRWYQMEMLQAEFDYHWVKCVWIVFAVVASILRFIEFWMSHCVTLVAGCRDYSFLWPPEREKEMDRVEVSMLQWQARFILQVGHERSCIATMVSNWAMMQRNLEALCRALESLDPEERSVEVKWPFRGFTARYDKFQRNKWLLARQRAHGEGGSFRCIFFVRFESEKCSENIQKASPSNLLWMTTVIYCGCTRLWDSSSQVSSFWSERVSNSPKRSDREEPCSSYRTR